MRALRRVAPPDELHYVLLSVSGDGARFVLSHRHTSCNSSRVQDNDDGRLNSNTHTYVVGLPALLLFPAVLPHVLTALMNMRRVKGKIGGAKIKFEWPAFVTLQVKFVLKNTLHQCNFMSHTHTYVYLFMYCKSH